jgi:hypothetical protein
MRRLPLAVYALAYCQRAGASPGTGIGNTGHCRAKPLYHGLRNSSPKPLAARIELRWLGPANEQHGFERRRLKSDWRRFDRNRNAVVRSVSPLRIDCSDVFRREELHRICSGQGILNFVNIADYAFALCCDRGSSAAGKALWSVLTSHPATSQPVAGVNVVRTPRGNFRPERCGAAPGQAELDEDQPQFEISSIGRLWQRRKRAAGASHG